MNRINRNKLSVSSTLTLLWSVLLTATFFLPAHAESIKIGGSGNTLGTMQLIANAYQYNHPEIEITILPSIGSSGGIKAVAAGAIDIGLSARHPKESEKSTAIRVDAYARTLTVVVVPDNSNITEITIEQLTDIYTGKLVNWPDGSLIRPILRQVGDDNTIQLKSLSPSLAQAVDIAETRLGMLFASTDQEAVNMIQRTPGSFGVTSLALIISEQRPLRALTLDGIEPTADNIESGLYPMVKNFYLILPDTLPQHVEDFVSYIKSPEGASILKQNGHSIVQ